MTQGEHSQQEPQQQQQQQQQQPSSSGSISSSRVLAARIASSSAGSIVTSLVVHPLDVVKVKLQKNAAPVGAVPCPVGCGTLVLPHHNHQHEHALRSTRGEVGQTIHMMKHIFRTEGTAGLYRGLRPTLIMAFPSTAIYYTSYEELAARLRQRMVHHHRHNNNHRTPEEASSWVVPIVAGGSARLLASTITSPLEYMRTIQAASSGGQHHGGGVLEQFTKMMLQQHSTSSTASSHTGWRTLFRGIGPTLARDVPFSSIYWLSLEKLREGQQHYSTSSSSQIPQLVLDFTNGAIAGMIAAGITTPADVIKTRMQTASNQRLQQSVNVTNAAACGHNGAQPAVGQQSHSSSATTSRQVLMEILEREGFRGLWRGSVARVLKVAPACAIMISSYELGKRVLEAQ